jgi:ubiquinone/menaquinone biosynthesis C-methylase UbiE
MGDINEKIGKKYDLVAHLYDLLDYPFEAFRYKQIRKKIWKLAYGKVLDAGMGTGRNIPFYPEDSEVYGIDISNGMLMKAAKRAKKLKKDIHMQNMNVATTIFPNNHFDTIVATFLFCVMPDTLQPKALKELKRICKVNGKIILLEYEYSHNPLRKIIMKLLSPYVKFFYNARFDRRTAEYIKNENFRIIENTYVYQDTITMMVLQPKHDAK